MKNGPSDSPVSDAGAAAGGTEVLTPGPGALTGLSGIGSTLEGPGRQEQEADLSLGEDTLPGLGRSTVRSSQSHAVCSVFGQFSPCL